MQKIDFNKNWRFSKMLSMFESFGPKADPVAVDLPHDAMLAEGRDPQKSDGSSVGYFKGGQWKYEKTFTADESWRNRRVFLEFEGVYRDGMVYVNESFAGQWAYGYSQFTVDLNPFLYFGEENTIRVELRAHKDSRWYSGAGIYRPVWLHIGELVHIDVEGARLTPQVLAGGVGKLEVDAPINNDDNVTHTVQVNNRITECSTGEMVSEEKSIVTIKPRSQGAAHQILYVNKPKLWSPENPDLYTVETKIYAVEGDNRLLDTATDNCGFRTIWVTPEQGFVLNGESLNLRGSCIHHDNGILGAKEYKSAAYRRVRIMKDAGFNALRSSHHPMSKELLQACDELGMLVMDESFDMWHTVKNFDDYAVRFEQWWKKDVAAMVVKDYNHPSVVMYSIGNEIIEIALPQASVQSQEISSYIRSMDSTRLVTNAINCGMAIQNPGRSNSNDAIEIDEFNKVLAEGGSITEMMKSPRIGNLIEGASAGLDVVGLNYGEVRYEPDHENHPNRVFVGSETFPTVIGDLWQRVEKLPYLIGDFTWTGWDYLGEVGVGRPKYESDGDMGFAAQYPYLTGNCGDIDITGRRRTVSYYREIVYGLRKEPYVCAEHR